MTSTTPIITEGFASSPTPVSSSSGGDVTVRDPSMASIDMGKRWTIVDAIGGDTFGMRKHRVTYLPQEPKETDDAYEIRLERSFLYPGFQRSVQHLTGKAFSNALAFDGMTPQWDEWFKNINLAGAPMQQFAQELFVASLKYGHTSIMIDYPNIAEGATLFDERQVVGARPYMCHRMAKNVLGWRTKTVENVQVLDRVRILEMRNDFQSTWDDDTLKETVRVLEPGRWSVYEQNDEDEWLAVDMGTTSLQEIPLVPIYFDNNPGILQSRPPLMDIAWTNVAHWQSSSDQRNILRVARVPLLFAAGVDPEAFGGELTVAANRLIAVADPNAKMTFVEHTGRSIHAGRQDLMDLEEAMATFTAESLQKRPGMVTATASAVQSRDSTSPLGLWCSAFEEGFNEALEFMAEFAQLDASPTMQMSRDFGIIGNASDLDALIKSRASGEITRETFLGELKRRGVLGEQIDPAKEAAAAKLEGPDIVKPAGNVAAGSTGAGIDTGN